MIIFDFMIGIFDSGMGGLSVAREMKKKEEGISFSYFGDLARFPWGNKSQNLIRQYSSEICDFFIEKGIEEIVIACNTASALAGDYLRKKYPEIKFYDVVVPVIEKIQKEALRKKILKVGVIGTKATIGSDYYLKKIKQIKTPCEIRIYQKACPLFAPMVEENWTENEVAQRIVKIYLEDLKKEKIDVLVLGCTHYPMLEKTIAEFLGEGVLIINSAKEVTNAIGKDGNLKKHSGQKVAGFKEQVYYFSDWTDSYQEVMENILGEKIEKRSIKLI